MSRRSRRPGLTAGRRSFATTGRIVEPFLDQIDDWDQLTLARYAHRTTLPPYSGNAGLHWRQRPFDQPATGAGRQYGPVRCGGAQPCAGEFHRYSRRRLAAYARARRNHVRLFQMLSLAFTPFYQSDSTAIAWVRDRLVSTIAKVPPMPGFLASIVAGTVIDPFQSAGLTEHNWLSQRYQADGALPEVAAVRSSAQI